MVGQGKWGDRKLWPLDTDWLACRSLWVQGLVCAWPPHGGVEHGQGIMPWTPKSGYTDHRCITNTNLWNHWSPFNSIFVISPTLLLLGLPWLTGKGDFLSRGLQQFFMVNVCALGHFVGWSAFIKGSRSPKHCKTNKTWLRGWNSGLLRWGQAFVQVGTRVCHRQAWLHWYIMKTVVDWGTAWVLGDPSAQSHAPTI